MVKKISAFMATALGLLLLVYSATRSLNFIGLTLPADKQILAWFGLAALDGGLIAWLLAYLYGSRGGWQRAISLLMIIADLLGAVAMFTLDTLYQTGLNGMTTALTPDEIQMAVLALSGVIALNIAATVAHHLTEPERLKEAAEEEAFSKVEEATLKQISKNADQLAAQLAPTLAADWMSNTRARYTAYLGSGKIPSMIVDSIAKDVPAAPEPARQLETTQDIEEVLFKSTPSVVPAAARSQPAPLASASAARPAGWWNHPAQVETAIRFLADMNAKGWEAMSENERAEYGELIHGVPGLVGKAVGLWRNEVAGPYAAKFDRMATGWFILIPGWIYPLYQAVAKDGSNGLSGDSDRLTVTPANVAEACLSRDGQRPATPEDLVYPWGETDLQPAPQEEAALTMPPLPGFSPNGNGHKK